MEENGKRLPTVAVGWDAEHQIPVIKFDTGEFKTWTYLKMVLQAAADHAEFNERIGKMSEMQKRQAEEQQAMMLRQQLSIR